MNQESLRLRALRDYEIMDTAPERAFDELVEVAARFLGVPIALVSLLDAERQWFKAASGLEVKQTPKEISFCQHVIKDDAMLVVEDARQDERFKSNPLVTGDLNIRAYVGAPLRTPQGHILGTLCVIDTESPREFNDDELELLRVLSKSVMAHLETRRALQQTERARDALELANAAKTEFLARTSHEVRTPMAAIMGYTELILESLEDGVDAEAIALDLSHIQESSAHLVSLLDDLLDLAKVEHGAPQLPMQPCLVEALFNRVERHVKPLLKKSSNALIVKPASAEPLFIQGNQRYLLQILINLVVNANKFTERGEIRLNVEHDPLSDEIVVSVEDTGCGIAPEQLDRVFGQFEQVSPAEVRRPGVGLGLAISKRLTTMMQGRIKVTSELGRGSCFTLRFPRSAP